MGGAPDAGREKVARRPALPVEGCAGLALGRRTMEPLNTWTAREVGEWAT